MEQRTGWKRRPWWRRGRARALFILCCFLGARAGAGLPVPSRETEGAPRLGLTQPLITLRRPGRRKDLWGPVATSGTTPRGAFGATDVFLEARFRLSGRFGVHYGPRHRGASRVLGGGGCGRGNSILPRPTDAKRKPSAVQGGSVLPTTVVVNVTTADDPYAGGRRMPASWGRWEATFTLSQDGFSLSEGFLEPVSCRQRLPVSLSRSSRVMKNLAM